MCVSFCHKAWAVFDFAQRTGCRSSSLPVSLAATGPSSRTMGQTHSWHFIPAVKYIIPTSNCLEINVIYILNIETKLQHLFSWCEFVLTQSTCWLTLWAGIMFPQSGVAVLLTSRDVRMCMCVCVCGVCKNLLLSPCCWLYSVRTGPNSSTPL